MQSSVSFSSWLIYIYIYIYIQVYHLLTIKITDYYIILSCVPDTVIVFTMFCFLIHIIHSENTFSYYINKKTLAVTPFAITPPLINTLRFLPRVSGIERFHFDTSIVHIHACIFYNNQLHHSKLTYTNTNDSMTDANPNRSITASNYLSWFVYHACNDWLFAMLQQLLVCLLCLMWLYFC